MKKSKNFRILSRLDVKDGNLIKSINFEGLRKIGKISDFAQKYYKEGIDEIIYVDAVSSLYSKKFLLDILKENSKNIFIPITVGGGIKTVSDAKKILRSGGDKVAINTSAVLNPKLLQELADKFGSQSIVSYIEAKKKSGDNWEVYINNGKDKTGIDVMHWVDKVIKFGAGELLIVSIDCEGTKKGLDIDLYKKICSHSDLPIIANGGFGELNHIEDLSSVKGIDALAISSAIHYNILNVKQIKNYCKKIGLNVRI